MRATFPVVLALAIAAASMGTPRDAFGAPPPSAQDAAREAFANGERLFARGDYEEARESFEKAFRLVSHDAVRFNIAVCLERLQRYRDALTQYRAAQESTMLDASQRSRAADAAARVTRELGWLVVSGARSAAPVSVDGEVRCSVPCRIVLDPRAYQVAVGGMAARPVVIERGAEVNVDASSFQPDVVRPVPEGPPRSTTQSPPQRRGISWLTWTGAGLGVLGAGGALAFGLRTESLHSSYVSDPNQSTLDEGVTSRTITNVSLVVAAVGLALVAVDLFVLAPRPAVASASLSR